MRPRRMWRWVVTDAGELADESRAAAGRYLRRELVSRVRANEAFLRDLGVWGHG